MPHRIIMLAALVAAALAAAPAHAEELGMDWVIEGQGGGAAGAGAGAGTVASYGELVEEPARPVYDRFVTGNGYSIGDHEITIHSEEGQALNGMIIEQRELQQESFEHKIRYYDRFSDGYVEVAEALLDPIGDSRYIIGGQMLDYNPNSNLELFVMERGYSLDDLESIPNDIFSPKRFTLGRQLMAELGQTGEGGVDLRQYAINHMHMDRAQVRERMMESVAEQNAGLFEDIVSGNTLGPARAAPEAAPAAALPVFPAVPAPRLFEDTGHVRESLRDASPAPPPAPQIPGGAGQLLVLLPVAAGLAALGYVAWRRRPARQEAPAPAAGPPEDHARRARGMAEAAVRLYAADPKAAHEALARAVRYHYSRKAGVGRDVTGLELIGLLRARGLQDADRVEGWLLLCGAVEYARTGADEEAFMRAASGFSDAVG